MRGKSRACCGAGTRFGIVLMVVLLLGGAASTYAASSERADQTSQAFSGIVEEVNTTTMKILVKTDIGKSVTVDVSKPELLKDLGPGDRITVQVSEQGKATKIMKNTVIPELKAPGAKK